MSHHGYGAATRLHNKYGKDIECHASLIDEKSKKLKRSAPRSAPGWEAEREVVRLREELERLKR
ncbi:MAG TPA: hypothetical protein VF516_32380 [Kofleriaceae bacterium]